MPAVAWRAAILGFCLAAEAAEPARHLPDYTAASIVNAATNEPGPLAPLGLVSLYGAELSTATRALAPDDIRNGLLPTLLGAVSITIDNVTTPLLFVSPSQINFLVPGNLRPGRRRLVLQRAGVAGPTVDVVIAEASPGFFRLDRTTLIAVHPDGSPRRGPRPLRRRPRPYGPSHPRRHHPLHPRPDRRPRPLRHSPQRRTRPGRVDPLRRRHPRLRGSLSNQLARPPRPPREPGNPPPCR